jgi:uncharacterized membrane protein YfcA
MTGAYLGARIAIRVRGDHLRRGFAILMACVALMMLL